MQAMFKQITVRNFYLVANAGLNKVNVIFQGSLDDIPDVFVHLKIKPLVGASGDVHETTVMTSRVG